MTYPTITPLTVDKNSPIPLYYQLAELIKEQIRMGELQPGVQLPSARDLSEQAGISRMTVRQAIAYLVDEGKLLVKPGVGTFVAQPKLVHHTLHLLGFTEEMIQRGGSVSSRVLEQSPVTPPPGIAAELALTAAGRAVKIVRLRLSEEMPLLLETIFIPALLCPGLEGVNLAEQSLYTILEQQYGLSLRRARQTIEATIATDYESRLFDVEPGTAMILLEGVTYDYQDRPVEYFKALYRGDRFKFELASQRNVADEPAGAPKVSVVLA